MGMPFTWLELTTLLACDLTPENALSVALERDALLTPAESRVKRREHYAHRVHGMTWEDLAGFPA